MPIYEYECTTCGKVEEIFQKFSDKPLVKCQQCGGKLHKLISHSSFHLKGTGWYVTDYAGKSRSNSDVAKKPIDAKKSQPSEASPPSKVSKSSTDSSVP